MTCKALTALVGSSPVTYWDMLVCLPEPLPRLPMHFSLIVSIYSGHRYLCQIQRYPRPENRILVLYLGLYHLFRCMQCIADYVAAVRESLNLLPCSIWPVFQLNFRISIIFRALQDVGGGGCFSLCTIMIIEIVPPEKYAKYVANISIVNTLALLSGPIVRGAIAFYIS